MATQAPERRRGLHGWLQAWVAGGVPTVVAFQRACGVTRERGPTNPVLHAVFTVAAALGDELFYITFFPFLFWEFDLMVARRVIHLWVVSMFVGQMSKELLRLPRPSPRLVVQLETHYAVEYGMPSTHAMTAVSLPWLIVWCCAEGGRYRGSVPLLAGPAAAWTVLTTLSRLYMGVHTPADLVAGLGLGLAALGASITVGPALDAALLGSPWTPALLLAALAGALWVYPRPAIPRWVSSPGDTAIIVSCSVGVALGCWLRRDVHAAAAGLPFSGPASLGDLAACGPRVLTGFALLLGVRTVAKGLAQRVFAGVAGPAFATRRELLAGGDMHHDGPPGEGAAATTTATTQPPFLRPPLGAPASSPGGEVMAGLSSAVVGFASSLSPTSSWAPSASPSARSGVATEQQLQQQAALRRRGKQAAAGSIDNSTSNPGGSGGSVGSPSASSVASSQTWRSATGIGAAPGSRASLAGAAGAGHDCDEEEEEGEESQGEGIHRAAAPDESSSSTARPALLERPAAVADPAGDWEELVPVPLKHRYEVELPTKAVTYTAVGLAALYGAPMLMAVLGMPFGTDAALLRHDAQGA